MNILAGLGSMVSCVCSTIGNAIGGTIGSLTGKMGELLTVVLDPYKVIEIACKIIKSVAESLGLIEKEENVEELGVKATQPNTKRSDEFESTEEYIKYLREEVELDKKRYEGLSKEEKLACKVAGTAIVVKGVEEKSGMKLPPEFLVDITKINLKHDELGAYIESFKMNGISDMKVMTDYLSGKGEYSKADVASKAIVNGLLALNPQMSIEEVQDKLVEMKEAARQ